MPLLTINPTHSTYLNQGEPSNNFAGVGELWVGHLDGYGALRGLLRFDLSAIPAGSTINSATLTLFGTGVVVIETELAFAVYRAQSPWTEAGATWNTYDGTNAWPSPSEPGHPDALLGASADLGEGVWQVDATALAVDALANRGSVLSLMMRTAAVESGANNFCAFLSSTSELAPDLTIDYLAAGAAPRTGMNGGLRELVGNLGA